MSDTTLEPIKATTEQIMNNPALLNPAVVRCWEAMRTAGRDAMTDIADLANEGPSTFKSEDGKVDFDGMKPVLDYARKVSNLAYKEAMPPLSYAGNIRDFIACVAHGVLLGVFEADEASKLVYFAQVAGQAEAKRYKDRMVV